MVILFRFFGLLVPNNSFQSFDYEHIWWRLSQKLIVRTNLDIYVFILPYHSYGVLVNIIMNVCLLFMAFISSCHVHANIDIECLYLSLYHCNALVYENKESWILSPRLFLNCSRLTWILFIFLNVLLVGSGLIDRLSFNVKWAVFQQ